MLYVRNLDSSDVKLLPGSEAAIEPFWSPDSRSVAFGSNGKLKRSDLTGANAQVICDAARLVGGTWNKDGIIVFAPDYRAALVQDRLKGGEPKPMVMKFDENADESHRYPGFLPDGRHFLFRREAKGIWVGSLDSPETKQILTEVTPAVYASPGWLVFVRNDALVAQAFDAAKSELRGEPVPIITGQKNPGTLRFSVSDNGVLIWQGQWERDYQLVWFDRSGKETGTVDVPMKVNVGQDPQISPDGKRLVVKRNQNIWVIDLEKGTALRLTSTFSQMPFWSPDGNRITFSESIKGLTVKAANGSGDSESLLPGANFPGAWSPDGRFILFVRRGVKTRMDVYAFPLFGERKEYPILNSPFDEQNVAVSPDGHWLVYASDESGAYELYVQPFSADGRLGADKQRISSKGGKFPVWRRDGKELFFIAPDGQMMSSAIRATEQKFEFDIPKALFKTRMLSQIVNFHEFDVSPDGQRFLIGTVIGDTKASAPTVLLNWTALVQK